MRTTTSATRTRDLLRARRDATATSTTQTTRPSATTTRRTRARDLLRARRDEKARLGLDAVVQRLLRQRGGPRHVLVRRVGARADQAHLELLGPVVLLHGGGELRQRRGQIGRERPVDVGLQRAQVDLNDLKDVSGENTECSCASR
jgi:hypothetical protein